MSEHTARLALLAELHAEELALRAAASTRPRGAARLARAFQRLRQGAVRKLREVVQEHWDLALFDVAFGSIKAFGIYPALYFAGWAWTIPLMEYVPLNTQLWTAGYLLARGEILSRLGTRRYGHSLKSMDALRDQALAIHPLDARSIHRFRADGVERTVRVRRSRMRDAWNRWRGRPRERNVVLQSELRGLVDDPEFRFHACGIRNNAHLYEKVLLERILSQPEARQTLLARLVPEPPLSREGRALREAMGETHQPAIARVVAGGDALTATLSERFGSRGPSASGLALRWIHWAYQRRIYGLLDVQRDQEYRLLADLLDGTPVEASRRHAGPAAARADVRRWITRAEAFAARARALRSRAEARQLMRVAIGEARALGLPVRLARAAERVSSWSEPVPPPSGRRPGREPLSQAAGQGSLDGLRRREVRLEHAWQTLCSEGRGYSGVRADLAKGALSAEERGRRLRAADHAQSAFLDRLDTFQRELNDHFISQVEGDLERAVETMVSFYGERRIRAITRRHRNLAKQAHRCRELAPLYGTAKDHRRIAATQRFYANAVAFSDRIRHLDPTAPRPRPPSPLERLGRLRRALVAAARRSGALLRAVGSLVALLAIVLGPERTRRGTPFTRHVDGLFRGLGGWLGMEVQVDGRENLPWQGTERTVNLFTPTHRHGLSDNVTFAHLALPDYLVFNAVDQLRVAPRFLRDRAARTPGLIAVGGGRGPSIDRALACVEAGISHNVLIYPEGSVSEGFGGTRPPRDNFGEGLVPRIRELDFELNLVPVSYLDNARFLDLPPRSDTAEDRRRRVAVSPPLDTAALDALLSAGGGGMVNHMVRLAWLESLVSDERSFLGMTRVAEVCARLDLELDGARYWGSLESAPVSDQLRVEGDPVIVVREEPFRGKRVRVFQVPEGVRNESDRIVLPDLRDPDSRELLIGIRQPAHIYLSVGPRRFDGDILRPLQVKERDTVFPGIVIRFVGIPVKSLNAIRRVLEEYAGREQRTLTCANSACRVIARAANIRIDDHAELRPFVPSHVLPTRTIRKLIERGVRNHRGEPVEVQIYNTDGRSLETVLAEMRRAELRIAGDHLRLATVDAARASGRALRARAAKLGRRTRS